MDDYVTLPGSTYEEALAEFEFDIPENYNAAYDLIRKHDDPKGTVALFQGYPDGRRETYTFHDVDILTNRVANALEGLGVGRGDRVAVMVPQKPANMFTHLACWKIGAISVPLSVLFGDEALRYRLEQSGSRVLISDESVRDVVQKVRDDCPELEHVIEVDGDGGGEMRSFDTLYQEGLRTYDIVDTGPDTDAIIAYTSGSTGQPKGTLHTHDAWLGQCPAYTMHYGEGDIEENILDNAVTWTHADWAWMGSLGTTLFPTWHYGRPIVSYPIGKFDPELIFEILDEFPITHGYIAPTALREMMNVEDPAQKYDINLEALMAGGEPVTAEIHDWIESTFDDILLNESYGQSETILFICNCHAWFEARPGSMGKRVPGRSASIFDTLESPDEPKEVAVGEIGEIVTKRDEPGVFEEYWEKPEKTAEATIDGWHRTGDLAKKDEDGYYWYESRIDDVILTSGYRVGPTEVEDVLLDHPKVEQVGVIGVPDERRNEIIKAFVEPVSEVTADEYDTVKTELENLVQERLAKYEYPREIEFMDDLPKSVTGKILRTELYEMEMGQSSP